MSHKQHSESGRHKSERREHDRRQKSYMAETGAHEGTGNPYHLSKGVRMIFAGLTVIVIISVTALFIGGFIRW